MDKQAPRACGDTPGPQEHTRQAAFGRRVRIYAKRHLRQRHGGPQRSGRRLRHHAGRAGQLAQRALLAAGTGRRQRQRGGQDLVAPERLFPRPAHGQLLPRPRPGEHLPRPAPVHGGGRPPALAGRRRGPGPGRFHARQPLPAGCHDGRAHGPDPRGVPPQALAQAGGQRVQERGAARGLPHQPGGQGRAPRLRGGAAGTYPGRLQALPPSGRPVSRAGPPDPAGRGPVPRLWQDPRIFRRHRQRLH